MTTPDSALIATATARLAAWFATMRTPTAQDGAQGYTGPVAHWWQNTLQFTGVGLDWRYEGLIHAYLNLYRATADPQWLTCARRAGDDVVRGQLPNGHFRNS
ncbi:MAG: hypothetical protein GYB67_00110, partial [Chloroflexi bacterium]|nr:hypothetical protein [Chloroflexota bacterium]